MCRWPRDESIAEVWEESVQHVRSFLSGKECAEEIVYKWMFTRMLAKYKRECADSIWKQQPKTVPEAVAAMKDWEHRYGSPAKVFMRKLDIYQERKVDSTPQVSVKQEPMSKLIVGVAKVKIEKDWSQSRYGQRGRSDFKCYRCGEVGHIKTKTSVKRVEVESEEEVDEVLLLKDDQTEQCEIDTGAQMCMIPERLAAGLQVIDKRSCHSVGPEFMASVVKVKLSVGPIDRVVKATVTPTSFCSYPLVDRNIGLDNLLECARLAKAAYDVADPFKQHAVQTRAQSKKELKLELQAAKTRREEHPLIKKPEEVCQNRRKF